jgi:phage tail sheath protein FI
MPEYLTPGVYIEEIERGPRPIEGVPTSTAAFLGEAERGTVRPRLVTSQKEYRRVFGAGLDAGRWMFQAVSGFFENGGKRLYVCRVVGANAAAATMDVGDLTIVAAGPGTWGNHVWARIVPGTTKDKNGNSVGFRLLLAYWPQDGVQPFDPFEDLKKLPRPQYQEAYDDLSVDPLSPDYYGKRLLDSSTNAPVSPLASLVAKAEGTIAMPAPTAGAFLDSGTDGAVPLTPADYEGAKEGDQVRGLQALELDAYRDVALVYAPHPPTNNGDIATAIVAHCEGSKFRFAVIDGERDDLASALNPRGALRIDSPYAAFYAPWIVVSDPETGARVTVPPGGHALGIYARTDIERGVFKAPANEIVQGALDVLQDIDDGVQGVLNPLGVNAIRRFPTRGIRVWGARTLSSNGLWKYVSVRRLFIFLERSIYEGTQWVVFEPNDDRLWARVKDTIRLFLRSQWRGGALFGRTEDEAFFITCDRTTMTQDDILNGRLICEIGIAPVRPAEFVVFRIFQNTAEAQR